MRRFRTCAYGERFEEQESAVILEFIGETEEDFDFVKFLTTEK